MRHHTKFLILSAAWVLLFVRFDLVLSFLFSETESHEV